MNLFEHLPGCTPVKPCAHCETVSILRSKISQEDIIRLAEKLKEVTGDPPLRPQLEKTDMLARSIDEVPLSKRTANSLRAYRVFTIDDLIRKREAILKRHLTKRELNEVKDRLAIRGLSLGTKTA